MWKLIRKIFVDIVFVTILYMVSYTNRDSNAILQVNHLRQFFLNLGNSTYDYTQIISINQYWNWLQMNFISNIRVQSWYNGDPAENMTNYINDKSNRLIGWATMRQLRIGLNANCRVPNIMRSLFNSCKDDYSILNEEQRSFTPGWILSNNKTYSSSIKNAFIYRTSSELNSYIYIGDHATYGSGGYVYEFLGNLNDLQENLTLLRQLSWIDKDSRAVMIQLNLYNPNVNFFTSVTLLIEILNSGGIFPTSDIVPMKTYVEFNNFSSIFYLIIAFIYIIFIIYFTIIEIYSIYKIKKEYFRQIHSYIEWSIIGCSWAGVAVYIWRYSKANRIEKYFHQTNGFQYINLQFAAYVDNVLTFLLGFCCFFGTIRLLRLFKIYPNIHMFFQILNRAFKDIISFSFMFLLLFFAFVFLFYLLFVSKILSYSTILQTIEVLFQMLLLKFNFHDLNNADPFLGPFVFVLFIYFIVFICITMFITIIMHHLRFVRKETRKTEKISPKIFSFIIQDLIKRTGFKKLTKENLQAEYKNPVEQLPEKIDELFAALDKSVMTYTKSEIIQISKSLEISSIPTTNPRGKRRTKKHVIY